MPTTQPQELDSQLPLVLFLGDDYDEEDHAVLFPLIRALNTEVLRVDPRDIVVKIDGKETEFSTHGYKLTPSLVVGWVYEDLLTPGMALLEAFSLAGVPVINDAITLFRCQNKFSNSALLGASGVAQYPIISATSKPQLNDWVETTGLPVVAKPPFGYGGLGLRLIRTREDLVEFQADLECGEFYYVVPWVENPGRDIRVYTINHHAVFAMYRYASAGEWITNVTSGGRLAQCPLTDDLRKVAEAASRAAGTFYAGVDIGEDLGTHSYVVYEVNSCPSAEPIVLPELAGFLAEACRDLPSTEQTWSPSKVVDQPMDDAALFHESSMRVLWCAGSSGELP